jgi:hypothetical protein
VCRLPTGLPSRCHDVLVVAYEEGFPVISRLFAEIAFGTGNSITRQGISLGLLLYDLSDTDRRVDVCLPPYVAIGPGPYLRLSRAGWRVASEGSWRMKRQWTSLLIVRTRCIVTRTRVARDPRIFQHIASCTVGIASAGGNERPLLARKGHVTLGPL